MVRVLLLLLLLLASSLAAADPVYVVLWFDTEDYIEPAADDAALRIANDLTAEGVHATFKVVGEMSAGSIVVTFSSTPYVSLKARTPASPYSYPSASIFAGFSRNRLLKASSA